MNKKFYHVKVTPGAKEDSIEPGGENRYIICTKAKAERNMANESVLRLLANELGMESKNLRIINGHTSRSKLISVI